MMGMSLLLAAAPVQRDSRPRGDTLVLSQDFSAPSEFARLTLEAGQVYRVELTDASALQLRTLNPGEQEPIVNRSETPSRASSTVVFEVAPSVTTTYEIRVGRFRRTSASIKVFWDANASARRKKVIEKG
jgi:hypothetical protein